MVPPWRRTARDADAPADDDARFCPSCGAPLSALDGAERKLATIVFADLVGSTELASSLDPEELRRRLAPFFDVARSALDEHGGTVEKYVGDAVMAVFGVPQAHGDDPDRAVAAALDLSHRVSSLDSGTGRAGRGRDGRGALALEQRGDLSVTGEAVNAAARLQQAARARRGAGRRARCAGVPGRARLEEREPIEAKGFPAPLPPGRAVDAPPDDRDADRGAATPLSAATTTSPCSSSPTAAPPATARPSW